MIIVFADALISHTVTRINLLKKLDEDIVLVQNANNGDLSKVMKLYDGIKVIEQPRIKNKILRYAVSFFFSLFLLLSYSPKIIVIMWVSRLYQTLAFLPFAKKKVISIAMGSDIMPRRDSEIKTKYFFTKLLLKYSRFIIVESDYGKEIIFRNFVQRKGIYILNFGVEKRFFEKEKDIELVGKLNLKDKKVFFSIRSLSPKYHIDEIVKEFICFVKKHQRDDFILLVSSLNINEKYAQKVKRIARESGIKNQIIFLKPIEHIFIHKYISISDIIISLSSSDGLSQSMIESLAAEKFLIYRDLKSYKKYLKHKKNSYLLSDNESLQNAFQYVLTNNTLYSNSDRVTRLIDRNSQQKALLGICKKILQ